MLIDIHCHLDLIEDVEKAIEEAKKQNVKIVAQGVNPSSNRKVLKFSEENENVKAALGIYPIDALKMTKEEIKNELKFIKENKEKIAAIGEVGIDYKEDEKEHEKQKELFRGFVRLSLELNKPIIVHSRKAERECIDILKEESAKKVIMHCFSGKKKFVMEIIESGWSLTVPTSVVRSQQFMDIAKNTPIEQLFCETDSPYLSPDKTWPNIPSNVVEGYNKLAEIKNISLEEAEKKIEENYRRLFQKD